MKVHLQVKGLAISQISESERGSKRGRLGLTQGNDSGPCEDEEKLPFQGKEYKNIK